MDPSQKVYFHAAFLKPGRTSYVVERQEFGNLETDAEQNERVFNILEALQGKTSKLKLVHNKKREFHVH